MNLVGVVLAAGAGSRFGSPKAEVTLGGERLVDRAVRTLRAGGCPTVLVVTRRVLEVPDALELVNRKPDRGLRSSLGIGVAEASRQGADAVCVVLADMPGVTAEGVRAVTGAWRPGRVAVADYGGRPAHPTVMSPELWLSALEIAAPDEGARAFLAANPELVDDVPVVGEPDDIDTPADLRRLSPRPPGPR